MIILVLLAHNLLSLFQMTMTSILEILLLVKNLVMVFHLGQ